MTKGGRHFAWSPLARKVLERMAPYSAFPESLLATQCLKVGLAPEDVEQSHLAALVENLSAALSRFTSPDRIEEFRNAASELRPRHADRSQRRSARANLFGPREHVAPCVTQVLDAMRAYTPLAWPILKTCCERAGFDPATVDSNALEGLFGEISESVGRFTSRGTADMVAESLQALASRGFEAGR